MPTIILYNKFTQISLKEYVLNVQVATERQLGRKSNEVPSLYTCTKIPACLGEVTS